ncbi:MAG: sensor histidine kinase [Acidimicrobiales bacterium]
MSIFQPSKSRSDAPFSGVSLDRRVTWLVLAFLAVVLALLDVVLAVNLRSRLQDGLVQRLDERARLALALPPGPPSQQLANRLSGGGIEAEILDSGAHYLGVPAVPPPPRAVGPPRRPPKLGVSQRERVAATHQVNGMMTLRQSLGHGQQVLLSMSDASVGRTIDLLLLAEVVASLGLLALAALVLGRVVRFALSPLERVVTVATRLAQGHRGERLAPSDTTTELGRMAAAIDMMVDSLERSAIRAEASEAAMRRFLTDASHELRTPVAGIQASTETLLRDNPPRARREELQVALVREVRRLGRLVDDLLDLARLDPANAGGSSPLRVVPVDLAELVRAEATRAQSLRDDIVVDALVEVSAIVCGDKLALERALSNLMDNAVRMTSSPGRITVSLALDAHRAVVEVSDTGPGVPVEERERVFERFVRLASPDVAESGLSRVAQAGSGLGLSIARASARAHGGDVVCRDGTSGVGASFVLTLPLMESC